METNNKHRRRPLKPASFHSYQAEYHRLGFRDQGSYMPRKDFKKRTTSSTSAHDSHRICLRIKWHTAACHREWHLMSVSVGY